MFNALQIITFIPLAGQMESCCPWGAFCTSHQIPIIS